jgi:hypothetical protein
MIYDVYFDSLRVQGANWDANLSLWEGFDPKKFLADYIKSGQSNDSFVFITTTNQESAMLQFIEQHGLKDFMSYEMPYAVTNQNHREHGRKLRLRVFQSIKKEAA